MGLLGLNFLPIAIPISFLFSVLLVYGRLSSDSELIAMRAAGWGLRRLFVPALVFGFVLSFSCLYITLDLVPWSSHSAKEKFHRITGNKLAGSLEAGTFTPGFYKLSIYVNEVNHNTGKLKGVFIYDERNPGYPITIAAKEGSLVPWKGKDNMTVAVLLRLKDGSMHRAPNLNDADERSQLRYQKVTFSTYDLLIKLPEISPYQTSRPITMQIKTLLKEIKRTEGKSEEEQFNRELRSEFWKRITVSFACLIFALLGVGLGIQKIRSVKSTSFLFCILVLLVYYALHLIGINLAEKGLLPIAPTLMAPDIIFLIIGIFLLRRATKS